MSISSTIRVIGIICSIVLAAYVHVSSINIMANNPSSPQVSNGRIYEVRNHKTIVYVSKSQLPFVNGTLLPLALAPILLSVLISRFYDRILSHKKKR